MSTALIGTRYTISHRRRGARPKLFITPRRHSNVNRLRRAGEARKRKGTFVAVLRHGCASFVSVKSRAVLEKPQTWTAQVCATKATNSRFSGLEVRRNPNDGPHTTGVRPVPFVPQGKQAAPLRGQRQERRGEVLRCAQDESLKQKQVPHRHPATTAGWVRNDDKPNSEQQIPHTSREARLGSG